VSSSSSASSTTYASSAPSVALASTSTSSAGKSGSPLPHAQQHQLYPPQQGSALHRLKRSAATQSRALRRTMPDLSVFREYKDLMGSETQTPQPAAAATTTSTRTLPPPQPKTTTTTTPANTAASASTSTSSVTTSRPGSDAGGGAAAAAGVGGGAAAAAADSDEEEGLDQSGTALTLSRSFGTDTAAHREAKFLSRGRAASLSNLFASSTAPSMLDLLAIQPPSDKTSQDSFFVRKVLCIISPFPFFDLFKSWLVHVYDAVICATETKIPIERYIAHLVNDLLAPPPGTQLELIAPIVPSLELHLQYPPIDDLPVVNFPMRNLFLSLDIDNVLTLLRAALTDQRILFVSRSSVLLFHAAQTIQTLIYPLIWCHPCVPELSRQTIELTDAPTPFIMGIRRKFLPMIRGECMHDLVVVDLDQNSVLYSTELPPLPKEETKILTANLRMHVHPDLAYLDFVRLPSQKPLKQEDWEYHTRQIRVSFLIFMNSLLHDFRACLQTSHLDEEKFVLSKSLDSQDFFRLMVTTQVFTQFVGQTLCKDLPPLYYRLLRGDATEESLREGLSPPSVSLTLPSVNSQGLSKTSYAYHNVWPHSLDHTLFGSSSSQSQETTWTTIHSLMSSKPNAQLYLLLGNRYIQQEEYYRALVSFQTAECMDPSLEFAVTSVSDRIFPNLSTEEMHRASTLNGRLGIAARDFSLELLEKIKAERRRELEDLHPKTSAILPIHAWQTSSVCDREACRRTIETCSATPGEHMRRADFMQLMFDIGIVDDLSVAERLFASLSRLGGLKRAIRHKKIAALVSAYLKVLEETSTHRERLPRAKLEEDEVVLWVHRAKTYDGILGVVALTSHRMLFDSTKLKTPRYYLWKDKPSVVVYNHKFALGMVPCIRVRSSVLPSRTPLVYSWTSKTVRDLCVLYSNELAAGLRISSDLDCPAFAHQAIRTSVLVQAAYATEHRGSTLGYLKPLFRYRNYPHVGWCQIISDLARVGVLNCIDAGNEPLVWEKDARDALTVVSELRDSISIIVATNMTATGTVDTETLLKCEPYAAFTQAAAELQKVELASLSVSERACFFINLYNVMTMHAMCVARIPSDAVESLYLSKRAIYYVDGTTFSLADIHHGILRCNAYQPFFTTALIPEDDPRRVLILPKPLDPRILFTLCSHNQMSPFVLRITPQNLSQQLERATVMYLTQQADFSRGDHSVTLPSILQDYAMDFGGGLQLVQNFIPYHINIDSPRSAESYRKRLEKHSHQFVERYGIQVRNAVSIYTEEESDHKFTTEWPSTEYLVWEHR